MDELNTKQTGGWPDQPATRTRRRRFGTAARWMAGLAVGAILAGGIAAGVSLTGGGASPRAASALLASGGGRASGGGGGRASGGGDSATAGSLGLAATVRSASITAGPGNRAGLAARRAVGGVRACVTAARHLRATGHLRAARAKLRSCLSRYRRLRLRLRQLVRRAEHGQVTFATKKGPKTLAFERGAIQSVSPGSMVVKAADGTTWTWNLASTTIVKRGGHRTDAAALSDGRKVAVVGLLADGADNARRVFIIG